MYSWEIRDFISQRQGILTIEESNKINNTKENPQLNHIIFHPYGNMFEMWDNEGEHFAFTVKIPLN